ncbi:winged helix-turn-helix transcriptional regulator [Paenibacillus wulumuqiensis]|uniref:winged helix-turn-helix transcriptional regulator n=1 Tax=Paenibacillus wulumuqiensis TaxID=1567107 RepID=UPI0006195A91|nr:helix-turn-helix domain-containing protein [Paenibacillus wulumuqiensis]
MESYNLTNTNLKDTGFGYTLSLVGGKYKMIVMYWLYEHQPAMRYNELKRCIGNISFKTLSNTLKELERDQLVIRTEYPQIPPKVEYKLSARGLSLMPILNMMCEWGERNQLNVQQDSSVKYEMSE